MSAAPDRTLIVPVAQLHPDPRNAEIFALSGIEDLARDILENGLAHYPVIHAHPQIAGEYMVIAGHRRRLALLLLAEQGHPQFTETPCHMMDVDEIDSGELLLSTNVRQRSLSTLERIQTITFAEQLVAQKRAAGRVEPGVKTDAAVAELVNLKPRVVAYYRSLSKLIDGLRGLLDDRRLTFTTARVLAQEPVSVQERVLAEIEAGGDDAAMTGPQVADLTASVKDKAKEPSTPAEPDAAKLVSTLTKTVARLSRMDATSPGELEAFTPILLAAAETLESLIAKRED